MALTEPLDTQTATADALARYMLMRTTLAEGNERPQGSWRDLSAAMDDAVLELTQPGHGLAAVALGGYGREQLCVHSDIDLMLLVASDPATVPPTFRALWDAGLVVGHTVRTPGQAGLAASERTDTMCSLLDARFVGGDEALFEALLCSVEDALRPAELRVALTQEELARREREPHHLQALNLKTGRGGLRALQAVAWLPGIDGDTSLDPTVHALSTQLLDTRQALHIAAGRAHDTLDFGLRHPTAAVAGIETNQLLYSAYRTARVVDGLVTSTLRSRASREERQRRPDRERPGERSEPRVGSSPGQVPSVPTR